MILSKAARKACADHVLIQVGEPLTFLVSKEKNSSLPIYHSLDNAHSPPAQISHYRHENFSQMLLQRYGGPNQIICR